MKAYDVLFYDILSGSEDQRRVVASSMSEAVDIIERAGEFEVIDIESSDDD